MSKKGIIVVFLLIFTGWKCLGEEILTAKKIQKQTFLYAIKKDSLFLDKYEIKNEEQGRPCVIFLFGGSFRGGKRDDKSYTDYFHFLAKKGFVVISSDYRLGLKNINGKQVPEIVQSLENAIAIAVEDLYDVTHLIIDKAVEWKIDPRQIIISGSSAGAITVLQAEYERQKENISSLKKLPSGFQYAGVIAFAGAILQQDSDLIFSPTTAPVLLFHGDADASVPYGRLSFGNGGFYGSDYIAQKLQKTQTPYCIYRIIGAGHEISTSPMRENLPEIERFLEKMVLKNTHLMLDVQLETIGKSKKQKPQGIEDFIRSNFK